MYTSIQYNVIFNAFEIAIFSLCENDIRELSSYEEIVIQRVCKQKKMEKV